MDIYLPNSDVASLSSAARRTRRSAPRLVAGWSLALLAACGQGSPSVAQARDGALRDLATEPGNARVVQLPQSLKELSGLAVTADGRYLGHNDELGIVYELDLERGGVVKAFRLGSELVRADFEGIAVVGDRVVMVTSEGVLYWSAEGADQEVVPYETQTTGIGHVCEVEGLAFEPAGRILLIPCKRMHDRSREDSVFVFRWSIEGRQLASPETIAIPLRGLTQGLDGGDFRPSAIERHPESGNYFLLSANERGVVEITPQGHVVEVRALAKDAHRQPEGIAFTPELGLLIGDEGKVNGQVTLYRRVVRVE